MQPKTGKGNELLPFLTSITWSRFNGSDLSLIVRHPEEKQELWVIRCVYRRHGVQILISAAKVQWNFPDFQIPEELNV